MVSKRNVCKKVRGLVSSIPLNPQKRKEDARRFTKKETLARPSPTFFPLPQIFLFFLFDEGETKAKKFHHQWLPDVLVIEKNSFSDNLKDDLKNIGHKLVERQSLGRMDCILVNNYNLEGGADKRGDNIALGY